MSSSDDLQKPGPSSPSEIIEVEDDETPKDDETPDPTLNYEYFDLMEKTDSLGASAADSLRKLELIDEVVDKADKLFDKVVTNSSELYLDAQVMYSVVTQLEEVAQNMDTDKEKFNLAAFAEQIKSKSHPKGEEAPWEALAGVNDRNVTSIPDWHPTFGPFNRPSVDEVPAQRERRAQRARDVETVVERPEENVQTAKSDIDQSVDEILVILKRLYRANGEKPLHYYRFVLNPTSFGKSVENIFHVSFLINDNLAGMDMVDGEPVIFPILESEGNDESNTEGETQERETAIISLDMSTWQTLIEILEIETAMI